MNQRVIYVGSSIDCHKRIEVHYRNKNIFFHRTLIIEMENKSRKEVFKIEGEYIKSLSPIYNRMLKIKR